MVQKLYRMHLHWLYRTCIHVRYVPYAYGMENMYSIDIILYKNLNLIGITIKSKETSKVMQLELVRNTEPRSYIAPTCNC